MLQGVEGGRASDRCELCRGGLCKRGGSGVGGGAGKGENTGVRNDVVDAVAGG